MKSAYVPMNGETGGHVGPNGKLQTSRIRNKIKRDFPDAQEIVFSAGHYYCSCFLKLRERWFYFSTSDYRFFPQQFLVRTATGPKDYTGGTNNNWDGFDNITEAIRKISWGK